MKKIFFAFISLTVVLTLSISSFASSITSQDESQTIDVKAKAVLSETPTTYSVDIEWDNMTFTYTRAQEWNPSTHTYEENGKWENTDADITVTNHSNASVSVNVTYNAAENTGIIGTIENGSATLAAGEVNGYSNADKLVSTLKISGTPSADVTEEGITVGTITVTIGK